MHPRLTLSVRAAALLILGAVPALAGAVGLGAIEVRSHLNEPLEARIALTGLKDGELDTLRAGLADEASFQRAGIERYYLLTRVHFSTETVAGQGAFVRIRSRVAIREPSLSLIVQLATHSATRERRYDVLLNLR